MTPACTYVHCELFQTSAGVGSMYADKRVKLSQRQSPNQHGSDVNQGYGYVCQTFDCSDFYEVPGLSKSKAE